MENDIFKQVRLFNRFYTVKLKLLSRCVLGTQYSFAEGRIIGEIGRNEGCSANNIAEHLDMDKSYLSRILSKLASSGLICRSVSEEDSRRKHLYLTESGRELYNELEALSDKQVETMLLGLDEGQVDSLLKNMAAIRQTLENTGAKIPDATAKPPYMI